MEMLVVIAIIGVLVAVGLPALNSSLDNARKSADLANMRSAYALASAEWMSTPHDGPVAYFFNGSSLQPTATGITGYGQSTVSASEFADGIPCTVNGTPNTFGKSNFIVVYCDALGVDSVSWGAGAYTGRQVTSVAGHEEIASDPKNAEDLDLALLNGLQDVVRNMTYGQIKELINKYNPPTGSLSNSPTCITIAICNVDKTTQLPDESKTKIYVPELFDAAGYDVSAKNLYIINSRDDKVKGDVIWVALNANVNNMPENEKATKAYTYVKSNGDDTNTAFQEATRKNL